ncbi:MAG TPA: toll/interleukin-1 receptor domain-containing protein [Thermoanaerobaculia bacterium]|nr:toll/interleukin-1 receptor domain-containing protein [Thermoanaerobaculia bacterium]
MEQNSSSGNTGPHSIFISYKREDSEVARALRQALRAEGLSVWWDEELRSGDRWADTIDTVLGAADAVVVLWSALSAQSDWVRYEAAVAKFRGTLAHARIDGAKIPIPFQSIHSADLSRWNYREDDPAFRKLLETLNAIRRRQQRKAHLTRLVRWGGVGLILLLSVFAIWMARARPFSTRIAPIAVLPPQATELKGVDVHEVQGSEQGKLGADPESKVTGHPAGLVKSPERGEEEVIEKLDIEIGARLTAVEAAINSLAHVNWLDGDSNTGEGNSLRFAGQNISGLIYLLDHSRGTFPDFKDDSFTSLLVALRSKVKPKERAALDRVLAEYRELSQFCNGLPTYEDVKRKMSREDVAKTLLDIDKKISAMTLDRWKAKNPS